MAELIKTYYFRSTMTQTLRALLLLTCICLIQCSNDKKEEKKRPVSKALKELEKQVMKPRPVIHYSLMPVNDNRDWLKSLSPGDTLNALLLINRIDKGNLLNQDTLVIPDLYTKDRMDYSPFPPSVPALNQIKKMVVVSYPSEAFGVYVYGLLIKWGPACLGKAATPTPTGIYFGNWKSKSIHSTENYDWILNWCFNVDNRRGVSLHEFILPGYPASHACVRLSAEDANWFYYWGEQWINEGTFPVRASGTPVLIYGEYPFGHRRPWRFLADDNKAVSITAEQLEAELEEFLPLVTKKQFERDSVIEVKKLEAFVKDSIKRAEEEALYKEIE